MMLAEAVQVSDEAASVLVFLFLAFLAVAAVALVLAVLGCVWAYRAGRGSRWALTAWMVVASVFGLALLSTLPEVFAGGADELALVPPAVLAVQGALFGLGRAIGPRGGAEPSRAVPAPPPPAPADSHPEEAALHPPGAGRGDVACRRQGTGGTR